MLRTTIAVFAAGIGGADAITVLPFTAARGLPDAFARRIARNTSLCCWRINLAKGRRPGCRLRRDRGSDASHCAVAWAQLQEIEAGGAGRARTGAHPEQGGGGARRRQAAVAKRRDALTGTSDYANLGETPVPCW